MGPFIELDLLDSDAEENFDRFLRLSQALVPTPVALFSIIDHGADRQFFKAARGLPEPWASRRQTPLSLSFCKVVQQTGAMLDVTDSLEHPRFRTNPAVEALGVRAYLGAPVCNVLGEPIGAFCVIDHVPRAWSAVERAHVCDLAALATHELQRREQEARAREINRVAQLGSWSVAEDGALFWSDEVFEIFGVDRSDFDGTTDLFYRLVHPDDVARVAFDSEIAWQAYERYESVHAIIRPDGQERIVQENAAVMRNRDGRAVRLNGTVQDITDHVHAGFALRQARSLATLSVAAR